MMLANHLARATFMGLRLLDVPSILAHARFQNLRARYYHDFWSRTAQETGSDCQKWNFGFHRLTRPGEMAIVRQSELRIDDHLTLQLMGNKALTLQLLAEQGLAVPRHAYFSLGNLKPALELLRQGRPLVVKPLGGTGGGQGVTTGITGAWALRLAALLASRFDIDLLAEEQIEGHSYRLLFLDGQFLDAVRRDPPRVTGDGKRSIRELVAGENRKRLAASPFTALSPLTLDLEARIYLSAQGLGPSSTPAAGETIVLKRVSNQNSNLENHVVTGTVHPATIATCARLLGNLGVRLAGVDIIAHDIAKPLGPENGLIGEINTTPGLHHHDLVAQPRTGPTVAARIVSHLFETKSGLVCLKPAETECVRPLKACA